MNPEDAIRSVLSFLGENPDREGLRETPARFIKALSEMTGGYKEDPKHHLYKDFSINDDGGGEKLRYDQIIYSGELPFVSLCEHHMLPFEGIAHIGYLPDEKNADARVVGLSKLGRLLDGYANRLQVQERLTQQIANAIQEVLKPAGVAVVLKARHTCQCMRGIKKEGVMKTAAMKGVFLEAAPRAEFYTLIQL